MDIAVLQAVVDDARGNEFARCIGFNGVNQSKSNATKNPVFAVAGRDARQDARRGNVEVRNNIFGHGDPIGGDRASERASAGDIREVGGSTRTRLSIVEEDQIGNVLSDVRNGCGADSGRHFDIDGVADVCKFFRGSRRIVAAIDARDDEFRNVFIRSLRIDFGDDDIDGDMVVEDLRTIDGDPIIE